MKKCLAIVLALSLLIGLMPCAIAESTSPYVIVVGGGASGLSAAISAAENGAKVTLFEKSGALGGAASYSSGALLRAATEGDPEDADTVEDIYDLWMSTSDEATDADLVRFVAKESAKSVDWLEAQGVEMFPVDCLFVGKNLMVEQSVYVEDRTLSSGGGSVMVSILEAKARELGVEIVLNCPATALSTDDQGNVNGVTVQPANGEAKTFLADAVILATGGFGSSQELLNQYASKQLGYGTRFVTAPGNTGDAIAMGTAVGAKTHFPEDVALGGYVAAAAGFGLNATGMNITEDGKRFHDESHHYGMTYVDISKQREAGHTQFWALFDQNNFAEMAEAAVEAGTMVKADTIEALAEQIGVDPATLKDTCDRYTEFAGQDDPDFGKTAPYMKGMSAAPFYATRLATISVGTFGGLCINTQAQILDENNHPISNLYGAGACANGSFFAKGYPYSGSCLQYSVTTGIQAGKNAAAAEAAVDAPESVIAELSMNGPAVELGENEYLGVGTGIGGDLCVKVTMDGDKIASVEIVEHHETDGISDPARNQIPDMIVAANSTEVDNISGATITSKAIKEAVDAALVQVK